MSNMKSLQEEKDDAFIAGVREEGNQRIGLINKTGRTIEFRSHRMVERVHVGASFPPSL